MSLILTKSDDICLILKIRWLKKGKLKCESRRFLERTKANIMEHERTTVSGDYATGVSKPWFANMAAPILEFELIPTVPQLSFEQGRWLRVLSVTVEGNWRLLTYIHKRSMRLECAVIDKLGIFRTNTAQAVILSKRRVLNNVRRSIRVPSNSC